VLIYYRIKKGNGDWFTNLYGVLFLEELSTSDYNINLNDEDERAGYIQRYPKFKKGNSWGLKIDLKIDAQPDSQMELREKEYDDPNEGVAMQMFTEALVHLNDCTKLFYEVKKENTDIEERLYTLENIVSGVDTMYELRDNVGILRNKIEMIQPAINSLEGRMEDVESKLSKLESNLGYLISDIKNFESGILNFENQILSKFEELSELVKDKAQISLKLNGDENETNLNKIIII
jgi:chromosome segregation ATPase